MKKALLSLATLAVALPTMAQQYIIVYNEMPVLASDVEKITYERYEQFADILLPARLAAAPKTLLFGLALQLTGLADTLNAYQRNYWHEAEKYYYSSHTWREVAWFITERPTMFTVFAETDDVLAAQGINSLSDLQAYAKQIYDAVYPEDAAISDPTDRRNSLNRFVAYHILPQGISYYYLTAYDGGNLVNNFDRDLADISAWYATLMPHAALKCSYPDGSESGLYLNRRGVKDGPDKYGVQIRGAKVDSKQVDVFNGYYYYIDQLLTYDVQTRDQVLAAERWRVDFKTLSPDIMNVYQRGNYMMDDYADVPDDSDFPMNGKNLIFAWDAMENITNDSTANSAGLIARRPHINFWDYEGDEMLVTGQFDMTVKLPPLPAGEWEVRLGQCAQEIRPDVTVWLNGQIAIDTLPLSKPYDSSSTQPKMLRGPREYGNSNGYGQRYPFWDNERTIRIVLGRIQSDGKSDNYLRLKSCPTPTGNTNEVMLDYLEFCPATICDNQEIPEDE